MSGHIFVKTLEEARRLAPNAIISSDEDGSDIPCHPYEVCLCETAHPEIIVHDSKAEITRLIRGDYSWLVCDSPESAEKREKYGLKKGSTLTSASSLLASYINPFAFNPVGGDDIGAAFPRGGWPERPSMAMSGRPLVLRSDDPLAEELKKRHGLGKESTEASAPDVPPVGTPKDRFLDFLRHAADALAQVDSTGDVSELQLLMAEQKDLSYLRQALLPAPNDELYHSHTAHENTKPTEKPKGRVERLIRSIDSVGGPVQDFMDLPAQHANPLLGPTDPGPEEILVGQVDSEPEMFPAGQVNGKLVWKPVVGDVAPSPGYEKLAVVGLFPAESGEMIRIVVPQADTPVEEMSDSDWWAALDKDCGAIRGKATVLTPAEHAALANLPGEPDEQP